MIKDTQGREGLSTPAMAKELMVSPAAVKKALAVLKVDPDFVKAGCGYYYKERLPAVKAAIR